MRVHSRVRRAWKPALGLVLAAALLGGCGSSAPSTNPTAALIAVPTQEPLPAGAQQACMAALLTGVLAADRRWGVVVAPLDGGEVIKVIWPNGFAGKLDASGLALVDLTLDEAEVARVGDRVEIGGGFLSGVDDAWFACGGIKVVPSG